jgi:putative lipoprotein
VRVRLEDVSRQDVAADLVAESAVVTSGEQVPVPFQLDLEDTSLDARARYALQATIESGGELRFVTTTSHPLPSEGERGSLELVVEPVAAPHSPVPSGLTGVRWALVELGGEPVADDGQVPYLELAAETSRLSGSGGCNRLVGGFEAEGTSLRLGPVATTLMACNEDVMRREAAFVAALEATTAYELEAGRLALLADDRVLARLAASS